MCSQICHSCIMHQFTINNLENELKLLKEDVLTTSSFNKKIYETNNTNVACCWWCCHKFESEALGLPEYIKKGEYYTRGCFCSFNCMVSYNNDLNDGKVYERLVYINQMRNSLIRDNKIIKPAAPRQSLKLFGGPLNIEQFRDNFLIFDKEFNYLYPPMISLICLIEETTISKKPSKSPRKDNTELVLKGKIH